MSKTSKNCILFFIKNPVKGEVKSRIASELDDGIALELYKYFILDMLATLDMCQAQCLICVYPAQALDTMKEWLGTHYYYLPQEGKDLGERMKNSFFKAFSMHYEQAILLGSDIPDLPPAFVTGAFRMHGQHDVTIGPSRDGGYYLIGFRKDSFIPEVFDHIRWGGKTVLQNTVRRVIQSGSRVRLLPEWSDIDTRDDLMALLQRNKSGACSCPKTIAYLATLPLENNAAG